MKHLRILKLSLIAMLVLTLFANSVRADVVDNMVNHGIKRQRAADKSQVYIDRLVDETEKIISKYHQQRKSYESLKRHNDRLRKNLEAQNKAVNDLQESIAKASLIERQIVPLMLRMIASLDNFIDFDLPFKLEERKNRINNIKSYLTNANISAAERFRKVLEAYTIENNYGKTIDAYVDSITIDGKSLTVNVLRLGRSAIYFQTLDGLSSGIFDDGSKRWTILEDDYNDGIAIAIKVAHKAISPQLLLLPIPTPEGV